jgi:hypothetical protein
MSRSRSWFARLWSSLALGIGVLLGGPAAAYAEGPGDTPPDWCFKPNAQGELPTCSWDGQQWHRSYQGGLADSGSGMGGFAGLFVVFLFIGVGITIWKVTTARRMARASGMNEADATTMTLLTDDGFEATYLAANLRGQTQPAAPPTPETRSTADRLQQLGDLRDQGLITPEEYDARRATIIDSV